MAHGTDPVLVDGPAVGALKFHHPAGAVFVPFFFSRDGKQFIGGGTGFAATWIDKIFEVKRACPADQLHVPDQGRCSGKRRITDIVLELRTVNIMTGRTAWPGIKRSVKVGVSSLYSKRHEVLQMVPVFVHPVGRLRIATVVDIAAEIGIRIVHGQKGRAVMTGKT